MWLCKVQFWRAWSPSGTLLLLIKAMEKAEFLSYISANPQSSKTNVKIFSQGRLRQVTGALKDTVLLQSRIKCCPQNWKLPFQVHTFQNRFQKIMLFNFVILGVKQFELFSRIMPKNFNSGGNNRQIFLASFTVELEISWASLAILI